MKNKQGGFTQKVQRAIKRGNLLKAMTEELSRQDEEVQDWWEQHRYIKACELNSSHIIVEHMGRRVKTFKIKNIEPPRGRLDRTVRVEVRGGDLGSRTRWAYHVGDEVLVKA
jgi:hypothetical protein